MNRRNFLGAGLGSAAFSLLLTKGTAQHRNGLQNSGAAWVRLTAFEIGQRLPDAVLVFSGVEAPPKRN